MNMSKMTKKKDLTPIPVLDLTDAQNDHLATLPDKDHEAYLTAISEYQTRLVTQVMQPARKKVTPRERATVERLFHKVRTEAGEVAAATYVRLFFPQNETFFNEVAACFTKNENPKAARKAMYKTKAWKREVKVTQKLVQYPLHK